MNDEIYAATAELESCLVKIKNTKAGKATRGVEANYGEAYQKLVRLGARPQLKGKYRG